MPPAADEPRAAAADPPLPDPAPADTPASAEPASRLRRWRKPLGYAVGLLLLAAAVVAVAAAGDPLVTLAPLAHANPALILGVVALTVVIGFFVSLGFWAVTTRYGHVGVGEMFALIAAAWLLNYLPAWPGMFGRLAYHKAVNGIPVRNAVKAIIWANAVNLFNAGLLAALVIGLPLFVTRSQTAIAIAALLPLAGYAVLTPALRATTADADRQLWRVTLCGAVRWIEMLSWAARFWLIFLVIDRPVTWSCALTLACLPTLVRAVPLAPNGIGVRTWAVGLTIVLLHTLGLPTEADPDARAHDLAWNVALTADLVLLAVELVVAVPLGLASSAYLAKRRRTARSSPHDDPLQDTTPRR